MHILEDIKPVSYLKSHTSEVLQQVNSNHRHVIITQNGKPKAVIQDAASFEKTRNALNLLKLIMLSEKDIQNGKVTDQDEVFKKIEAKLRGKK